MSRAPAVRNYFGDIVSHPKVVVEATTVEDIVRVLRDPVRYPSPVRAAGSNHSATPCAVAEGGTLIKMRMNRILRIGPDTMTVEAGAELLDMARALERQNLQFFVNPEIGKLTAGSAACAGTKDASMPGEFGQVGSYVIGVKMVVASGEVLEVTEDRQPELMQKVRSSYGTFGVIYEVTFRVHAIRALQVHHETFRLDQFVRALPELKQRNASMMYYLFPHADRITVEFKKYNPQASGKPNRRIWRGRNRLWRTHGAALTWGIEKYVSPPSLRYAIVDGLNRVCRLWMVHQLKSDHTLAADEIIDYPPVSDRGFTFSLFGFPEDRYPTVLADYFRFSVDYYRERHYRTNMVDVGYSVSKDQQSLLSYSYEGDVMTLDPVSTGNRGWKEFLVAFNQFCSDRNGVPLLNQTFGVTRKMAEKAFGARLAVMAETRRTFDPDGRLLNDYFRELFG